MKLTKKNISKLLEAAIFVEGKPISAEKLRKLLPRDQRPPLGEIRELLAQLEKHYQSKGVQLVEVASGYRFQVCPEVASLLVEQQEAKPMRFSKAFMETLALVAYRQPITRGEIEDIRGVAVSTNIIKGLLELEWIREVGHKDVPGKPALFATTRKFLDFFNLKSLEDLPPLAELEELSETRMTEEYQELDMQLSSEFDKARVLQENQEMAQQMGPFLPGQEPSLLVKTDLSSDDSEQEMSDAQGLELDVLDNDHDELTLTADETQDENTVEESEILEKVTNPEEAIETVQESKSVTSMPPQQEEKISYKKTANPLEEEWTELGDLEDSLTSKQNESTDVDLDAIASELQRAKEYDEVASDASSTNHRPLDEFTDIVLTQSSDDKEDDAEIDSQGIHDG